MSAFDDLLPGPDRPMDSYRWATVTSMSPIRIRLDGDTVPVESTPVTLCPLRLGCRVWVQIHGRMMIIIGVAQTGVLQIPDDTNLNDVQQTTTVHQNTNSKATTALNYPTNKAGLLEVTRAQTAPATGGLPGVITRYVYQRYTAYDGSGIWVRTLTGSTVPGTWNAWRAL